MSTLLSPAVARALDAHEAAPTARTNAHLADASFRFDVEAPTGPLPRPRPGDRAETWTLAQTLQELRIRDVEVTRTTRGLRVRHAHRLLEVSAAVRRFHDEVGLWLDLGRPAPAHGWDDALALQIAWLRGRFGAPQAPVALRPGVSVTDWPRFVASVEGRYAEGPEAPCADGLRRDVGDLYARYADLGAPRVVRRAPARAA